MGGFQEESISSRSRSEGKNKSASQPCWALHAESLQAPQNGVEGALSGWTQNPAEDDKVHSAASRLSALEQACALVD